MKKTLILTAIVAGVVLSSIMIADPAQATKAMAEKENANCTACHDKPGSILLTDQGKYWELMGSFDGYDGLQANFGKCTGCHVREPGSAKLTPTGEKYQAVIREMDSEELSEWMMRPHPKADKTEDDSGSEQDQ